MTGDLERGDEDGDLRGEYFSCRTLDTSKMGVVQCDRRLRCECDSGVDDADDDADDDVVVATDPGESASGNIGSFVSTVFSLLPPDRRSLAVALSSFHPNPTNVPSLQLVMCCALNPSWGKV